MPRTLIMLGLLLQLILFPSISTADIYNPKPHDDDLVLPMPGNAKIAFRPVFIGENDAPFALREFKVGDRAAGGFKEYPTKVVIGGGFIQKDSRGQPDWMYYIGKYEVTEAQYDAVMNPGASNDSQKPQTGVSWYDVQEFIKKYNLWLYANARSKLPKNENAFGFIRLPTEIEWEFAARGGSVVDASVFDKKHPYPERLSKYEWFAGQSSSHGKVKNIGLLKPNPLKIYDMLGNVSEMTGAAYRIEYYQGRTGGFVSRGGNCFTAENKVRSSLRSEIPYFKEIKKEIAATQQPVMGFRLAISSPIYTSRETSKKLAAAWEDYRATRPTPAAPAVTALPVSSRTNVQLADALRSLEKLWAEIHNNPNVSQTAKDQVGLLKASFGNVESVVKKAEKESAWAWVKVASETAFAIITRDMMELPSKYNALKTVKELKNPKLKKQIEKIEQQIDDKKKNIDQGIDSYHLYLQQLEKIREEVVKKGFDTYIKFLKDSNRNVSNQIRFTEKIVKKHYEQYRQNKRFDEDKCYKDFVNFGKTL